MSLAVLPICRLADRYDVDNTVEASGTAPISFSLVSGPAGMTVSAACLFPLLLLGAVFRLFPRDDATTGYFFVLRAPAE
ncbi:MAG: hypothetical protein GY768_11260 [Planctomycetaceae bacterium]|nr:hypothetical protein [Planctomycetaceae bacterium]